MALRLGELSTILRGDLTRLRADLAQGRREVRSAGRDMERDATTTAAAMSRVIGTAGRTGGEAFVRGADGRLRDGRGRFVAAGDALGRAASGAAVGGLDSLRVGLRDLGTAVANAGSNILNAAFVMAQIGVASFAAVPGVYALAGALGSLPTLLGGLGATVGVLSLGLGGLSDAFKKTASGGGAVVDRAYQVAQAQRRVRDANREVTDSQEDLNRAWATAAERISDLDRSLTGARLDEEEALLSIQDAERRLQEARVTGRTDEIARADLAMRRARANYADAKDRTQDLAAEQADAHRRGVSGSDEVKSATDRQRRATEALADAQHALRQAQKPTGGGGGAGAEITKLAPAAQRLVSVLKGLKPAWEALRLDVQQRLLSGIAGRVQHLADVGLKPLRRMLGDLATALNGVFKTFLSTISRSSFIENISAGMESFRGLLGKVGQAVAGPLTEAFGRLFRASKPFVDMLGDKLSGIVTDFADWIAAADRTGGLERFFETASIWFGEILESGKQVGRIIAGIFAAFAGSELESNTTQEFRDLSATLRQVADWLGDPNNQKKIRDFFTEVSRAGGLLLDAWNEVGAAVDKVEGWWIKIKRFKSRVVEAWGDISLRARMAWADVSARFDAVAERVASWPRRIRRAVAGMWDGVKDGFRSAINWIIEKWNGLSFTIGGGNAGPLSIPSARVDTPDIPYLNVGGRIRESGMAVVHRGERVIPAARAGTLDTGGDTVRHVHEVRLVDPDGDRVRTWIFDGASARGLTPGQFLKIA